MTSNSYLPVPEYFDQNITHSHKKDKNKFPSSGCVRKKPPRLHPKHEKSFSTSLNASALAISFKANQKTELKCPIYQNAGDSYFEQCFEILSKIGEGSFGEVFKVRCRENGKLYAVKKLKELFRSLSYKEERLQEVKRHEQFSDHEHCVTLHKAWEQDDLLFMQMELCRENLESYIANVKHLPESMVWSILLDLLLALQALHDQNLIHLDIKLENILITDENVCKLGDFGLVSDLNQQSHRTEGDSRYIAPELMQGNFSTAADIFSLGTAVLELACDLDLPMNGELWQELRSGIFPEDFIKNLSPDLQYVIKWMMTPDPSKRPDVHTLLGYPKIVAIYKQRHRYRWIRHTKILIRKWIKNTKRKFSSLKNALWVFVFCVCDCFSLKHTKLKSSATAKSNSYNSDGMDENEDNDEMDVNDQSISQLSPDVATRTPENNIKKITLFNSSMDFANSTPLNHQNGCYMRKFRIESPNVDLDGMSPCLSNKKLLFPIDKITACALDADDDEPPSTSFLGKKLFFKAEDSDY